MFASLWGPKVDFWQEALHHLLVFRKTLRGHQRGAKEEGKTKNREKEGAQKGGQKDRKINLDQKGTSGPKSVKLVIFTIDFHWKY